MTLGPLKQFVDEQVERGNYASTSEVVRAGLRALELEQTHLDDWMRDKVRAAFEDPRPDVPAERVAADLRAYMAAAVKAEDKAD